MRSQIIDGSIKSKVKVQKYSRCEAELDNPVAVYFSIVFRVDSTGERGFGTMTCSVTLALREMIHGLMLPVFEFP